MYSLSPKQRISAISFAIIVIIPLTTFADDIPKISNEASFDGRWLIRMMGQRVTPSGLSSSVSLIGGRVDTRRINTISFDLSYFVTSHWSIEMLGGPFKRDYKILDSKVGSFDVGSISSFAVSLGVAYHMYPYQTFSPYVGIGFNHAWVEKVDPAPGIPKFDVKSVTSGMFSAGLNYNLNRRWLLSFGLRYIVTPTYVFKGEEFESTVSTNTLITGAGLGYRF
ncbi:OmpW/AlkL family protein [Pseudomonas sp. AM8]|uniref:OmpW/AlkL family protein n=1 Tax=Pseudomonas sp. AM8 TaxID=2983368 RepID=UPI003FA6D896